MITAIVQARMGSSRLPGKVLLEICGKPVLFHVIERLKSSKYINNIIIATSISKENDPIREFCFKRNIKCYSGSENDVLDRFYQAFKSLEFLEESTIVRITADCPLIDPVLVDNIIELHNNTGSEYTSNVLPPTFPDGLDCEVFEFSVLKNKWSNARLVSEREHVTLYVRNHPDMFKIENYTGIRDLSHLRWTLDELEDFQFIKTIYDKLYNKNNVFRTNQVLDLIDLEPNLTNINAEFTRNEGLIKSKNDDFLNENNLNGK